MTAPSVDQPTRLDGAALYLAALATACLLEPHGPIFWDSFGYLTQALTGQIGGLGLGRPLFVMVSHGLVLAFRAAGGSVWQIEPVVRLWWLGVSATAAPATSSLATAMGLSRRGALFAGLAVAASPAMAQTNAAVLTDGPSAALTLWALLLAVRVASRAPDTGRTTRVMAASAGEVFAAAVSLREACAWYLTSFVLLLPAVARPARLRLAMTFAAAVCGLTAVILGVVYGTQPGYMATIANWLDGIARERAAHHLTGRDLALYLAWLVTYGPLPLAAAVVAWGRRRAWLTEAGWVPVAICLPAVVELVSLAFYQDVSYSPRYLAGAFPGAIAIPSGLVLDYWSNRARWAVGLILVALAAPVIVAAPIVRDREAPLRETIARLPSSLASVPSGSLVVTGRPCPAIPFIDAEMALDRSRAQPAAQWEGVCPGWSWPADLAARLDAALAAGRHVVLDLRPDSWGGADQAICRAETAAYRDAHAAAIASGAITIWR